MTDWSPLIQAGGLIVTTVVVPWAIVAYQKRTGIALTDQQRAAVQAALTTAAGIIETKIDQGSLSVADLTPAHPAVVAAAWAAIDRVPDSAAAQGLTAQAAAEIVVGKVRTGPRSLVLDVPSDNPSALSAPLSNPGARELDATVSGAFPGAVPAALLALLVLGGCGGSAPASTVSPADVAALESGVTIAETLALNYTRLPACPAAKVCADPATKIKVKLAGQTAHDSAVALRSSSAAGAPAAYAAASAALAALEAVTPPVMPVEADAPAAPIATGPVFPPIVH
jgi:hypothetical protein